MLASDMENATGKSEIPSEQLCRCFSLAEIKSATTDFAEELVIGSGGYGKVYKGLIDDGATTVAIKRLNPESKRGAAEFWTEVGMLSLLRHAHLVALIGYCNDCEDMILVYEYIAHGSLADHLHKVSREGGLDWEQRLNICIGAARGLDYLHRGTKQSFIHRDVKTANILLDEKWVAKIGDFGLSKGPTSLSNTHITTAVKGTFGYSDPNYFWTRRLTEKSDVFAFGVVMLEVLCGRPAVDTRLEDDQINLWFWALQCIGTDRLNEIIDPSVKGQMSPNALKSFVEVAIACLNDRPQERPTMAEVVASLEHASKKKGHGLSLMKGFENSVESAVESFTSGTWMCHGDRRKNKNKIIFPHDY